MAAIGDTRATSALGPARSPWPGSRGKAQLVARAHTNTTPGPTLTGGQRQHAEEDDGLHIRCGDVGERRRERANGGNWWVPVLAKTLRRAVRWARGAFPWLAGARWLSQPLATQIVLVCH